MAGFTFITTGTSPTVIIDELDISLVHPQTVTSDSLELLGIDVMDSPSIQAAVDAGHLIVQDSLGNNLTTLTLSGVSKAVNDISQPQQLVSTLVQSISSGSSHNFTGISFSRLIQVWGDIPIQGSEIVPTGVVDPTNVSTGDANLINNNFGDLTYNNNSSGTTNKELPAIDLGSQQAVDSISVWWWSTTYTASDYSIQGSNDGVNFSDVVTGLDSTGVEGEQNITIGGSSFRYWRVFCVTGNQASWCVLSEMKAYGTSPGTTRENLLTNPSISIGENGSSELVISNNTTQTLDIIITYL